MNRQYQEEAEEMLAKGKQFVEKIVQYLIEKK